MIYSLVGVAIPLCGSFYVYSHYFKPKPNDQEIVDEIIKGIRVEFDAETDISKETII